VVELDITWCELLSGEVDYVQIILIGTETGDVSEGVKEIARKVKVGQNVCNDGNVPRVKRKYIKKDLEYWEKRSIARLVTGRKRKAI
jgi:hypothetical protein